MRRTGIQPTRGVDSFEAISYREFHRDVGAGGGAVSRWAADVRSRPPCPCASVRPLAPLRPRKVSRDGGLRPPPSGLSALPRAALSGEQHSQLVAFNTCLVREPPRKQLVRDLANKVHLCFQGHVRQRVAIRARRAALCLGTTAASASF
jgi:hypothetical protein